ncbi:hypothetical protein J4H64_12895 [Vibrio alginolyticus]|uniref:hypothetical protein n=1 Tax=Vibrio alginolyticus TaxID=663 RepID=UPI00186A907D|nr:hypothetical protein [Vibrio alginolyticus]MBE4215298.1 hypothetical protein [Vibrio parahaemolyticus]MBM5062877.1 hypothetical protein [Vibrio parahaemolyticus]MBS9947320.1 hypothetical protein [Vibrio alginolyticus]HCG9429742.1 hypothetical protein [Vibrio parahaemolyticus]HCG9630463.1 hypothetical protein [Vibrio parahaemolyticus]
MSYHLSLGIILLSVLVTKTSAEEKICDFDAVMYLYTNNTVIGKTVIRVAPSKKTNTPLYSVIQQTHLLTSPIIRQVWGPIDKFFTASNSCSDESKNIFSHSYQERNPNRVAFKVLARNESTKRLCYGTTRTTTVTIDNTVTVTFSAISTTEDSFLGFNVDTDVNFDNKIDGFLADVFPNDFIELFENLSVLFADIGVERGIQIGEVSSIGLKNLHFNISEGFSVRPMYIVTNENGVAVETQVRYDNGNLAIPNEAIWFTRRGKTNSVKSCIVMKQLCDLSSKFVDSSRKYHETPKKLIYGNDGFQVVGQCYLNKVYFTGQ